VKNCMKGWPRNFVVHERGWVRYYWVEGPKSVQFVYVAKGGDQEAKAWAVTLGVQYIQEGARLYAPHAALFMDDAHPELRALQAKGACIYQE